MLSKTRSISIFLALILNVGLPRARADETPDAGTEAEPQEREMGRFVFKIPGGWQDKSTPLITVAVDDKHKLVFQAKIVKGGDAADAVLLEKYVSDAERSLKKLMPQAKIVVLKKQLLKIAGLPSARFLFDMTMTPEQEPVRTLQFYMPAPALEQHAILTFTGPPAEFDKKLALFDRTARATVVKKQ